MTFDNLLKLVAENSIPVCDDSRKATTGCVFVAVKGTQVDGHDYAQTAVAAGAKYIVSNYQLDIANTEQILVSDTSIALGILAQASTDNPSAKLCNLAVTGTNGKTTVGFLVKSIIETANQKCGLVGTIVNDLIGQASQAAMTTPSAIDLANMQKQMVDSGATHMMIEASSHALDQNRLSGVNFKAAAFTNLTGDHLDYHLTMENYLAAKTKLFEGLTVDEFAILNKQADQAQPIAQATEAKTLYYAVNEPADISATVNKYSANGTKYTLNFDSQSIEINSPLIGEHNVSNHLAATGLAIAAGFNLTQIKQGLEASHIPGRLQSVNAGQSFAVLVDYAHTDDALKNVLQSLKPLCKGKLIIVFGCGGDRDKTKRPRMAKVAQDFSDIVIVTSDNPRTEDANAIIDDILKGFDSTNNVIVEPDRKAAIETAIDKAKADDIVLIAGKGHEDYQIIGKKKIHFSDVETAEQKLNKRIK